MSLPRGRAVPGEVPPTVRAAGVAVVVQAVIAVAVAVVLVVRGIAGADQHVVNGLGTALWFAVVGAVVSAAGRALMLGKRWGRGLAVVTELLLLPVAWLLTVSSHRPGLGIPAGVVALTVLLLLFSPSAVRWAARGQAGPASSANPGPDSR